jgi:prephenate dehydrogenase
MKSPHYIVIIGGHGQMGKLFGRLLAQRGHHILPFGETDWEKARDLLSAADVVIVSVPIALTEKVIKQAAPYLKPTAVLMDLTSNKVKPMQTMLASHVGPVLGVHPVFGPTIDKPDQQVMIYCDGRESEHYQWLLEEFRQLKFSVYRMSAEQHDRAMDLIQGLQHFITYCTGMFLKDQSMAVNTLLQVGSPLYQLQLNMMGRIFYQDAGLYADIIASDNQRLELLQRFIDRAQQLLIQLKQGHRDEFIGQFESVRQWMGEFAKEAQDNTDTLFNRPQFATLIPPT